MPRRFSSRAASSACADGLRGDDAVVVAVALPQVALDRAQHFAVVVDGQDDGLGHRVSGASERRGAAPDAGSVTRNSVPLRPGVHVDRAAMALDDAARDVEAETGALADVLGGEERIEDAVH